MHCMTCMTAGVATVSLRYDPPGSSNHCYYRCLSKFLNLDENDLTNMLESFMLENQVIPVENEVGVINIYHVIFYLFTNYSYCIYVVYSSESDMWHDIIFSNIVLISCPLLKVWESGRRLLC